MIRQKSQLEVKVGVFAFIGVVILTIIVFSIGGEHFFHSGYRFKVIFNFANGLEVGAPVRVAGVNVGEVKDIFIKSIPDLGKTEVEVVVWVEKNAKVQTDSKAYINTLGLLGEKYVEIIPGENYRELIKENSTLIGYDPTSMEEVTEKALDVLTKLDDSIFHVNNLLKDDKFKADLKAAASNISGASSSAHNVFSKIEKGEGTIGKLLVEDGLYKQLEEFIEDIKRHPWKLLVRTKEKKSKRK